MLYGPGRKICLNTLGENAGAIEFELGTVVIPRLPRQLKGRGKEMVKLVRTHKVGEMETGDSKAAVLNV